MLAAGVEALMRVVNEERSGDAAMHILARAARVVQGHNMPRADCPGLSVLFQQVPART